MKYRYELFQPEFNCPLLERIGTLGDGGQWMCGVSVVLQRPDCVVYSFGSNGNRVFEQAILETTPCRIYSFDPNHEFGKLFKDPRNTFEPLWLHERPWKQPELAEGGKQAKVDHLDNIMQRLGHARVDVLKMDIEGSEYEVLKKAFRHRPRDDPLALQIQLESHFPESEKAHCWCLVKLARLHAHLTEAGYLLFYKEPNPQYPHAAVEWSFLHESLLQLPDGTPPQWRRWTSVYNQTKGQYFCASVWSRTKGCKVGDFYDAYYQHADKETDW